MLFSSKFEELLLEMINLSDNKEATTNYFESAIEKMGGYSESISSINRILRWLHPILAKAHDYNLEKLSIYTDGIDNTYVIGKMNELFQYCPELNGMFVLDEKHITFNKGLSKSEIEEIRAFVDENTERKVGSVYIRKKD